VDALSSFGTIRLRIQQNMKVSGIYYWSWRSCEGQHFRSRRFLQWYQYCSDVFSRSGSAHVNRIRKMQIQLWRTILNI